MILIEEVKARLQVLETRLNEMGNRLIEIKDELQKRTDENAVKVIVDETLEVKKFVQDNEVIVIVHQTLDSKEYTTKAEVHSAIKEQNIMLIKWIVGTGISMVTLTVTLVQLLM